MSTIDFTHVEWLLTLFDPLRKKLWELAERERQFQEERDGIIDSYREIEEVESRFFESLTSEAAEEIVNFIVQKIDYLHKQK